MNLATIYKIFWTMTPRIIRGIGPFFTRFLADNAGDSWYNGKNATGGFAMPDHAEMARALFFEGYNCSQAVACAFCDVTGLDLETAARMASSFGGGLGRLREVCGTVSGAALVLGLARGYADPGDVDAKRAHYRRVQEFARRFREESGSIICRDLLRDVGVTPGAEPEARTEEFYRRRPCAGLAWRSARILEEMLAEEAGEPDDA